MRTKLLTAGLIATAFSAYAQEEEKTVELNEIVISGTKFEIPVEKSGKTIYKLTQEDLEKNAGKTVADLLNEIPGLEVNGAYGPASNNVSYYLRGGNNKNTLILIDGTPFTDPSGVNAFYDLRYLSLSQIESIEVLSGGLSTLYGTSASAGVINIILKKSSLEKLSGNAEVYGGSYGTRAGNINLNGTSNGLSYLISGGELKSDGFSTAARPESTSDFDKDGFEKTNILTRLGYQFGKKFELQTMIAYDEFDAEYDGGAYADADNRTLSKELRFGIKPTYHYDKGIISLNAVYNNNEREDISGYPFVYEGRNIQADLTQEHRFSNTLKGLFGINYQQLSYKEEGVSEFDDNEFQIIDPYASVFYSNEHGTSLHAGIRINTHSEYGSHLIYNFNSSHLIEINDGTQLKVRGTISTAFITPSLYQLYSPLYGNDELTPEESTTNEIGVSLYARKKLILNATYYERVEENPIDFVSIYDEDNYVGSQYANVQNERHIRGFELQGEYHLSQLFSLSANYSYIEQGNSADYYRLPKHKGGVAVNVAPVEKVNVSLKYRITGERIDYYFDEFYQQFDTTLEAYDILDIYTDYTLFDHLKIYGSINNIFGEQFVNTYGYNTRGRNFTIGLNYTF